MYWGITQGKLAPRGLPTLTASLVLSLGLAVASYELMEKRFLRLKDRFTSKQAPLCARIRYLSRPRPRIQSASRAGQEESASSVGARPTPWGPFS